MPAPNQHLINTVGDLINLLGKYAPDSLLSDGWANEWYIFEEGNTVILTNDFGLGFEKQEELKGDSQ